MPQRSASLAASRASSSGRLVATDDCDYRPPIAGVDAFQQAGDWGPSPHCPSTIGQYQPMAGTIRIIGTGPQSGQECVLCGNSLEAPPVWHIEGWGFRAGDTKWDGYACHYCVETHDGPTQSALSYEEEEAAWTPIDDPLQEVLTNRVWRASPAERKAQQVRAARGRRVVGGVRIHELARDLGLTSLETLNLCQALGIMATSHSQNIERTQADRVRRKAEREGLIRDAPST